VFTTYGLEAIEALVKVWAVLDGPDRERLRPVRGDLVAALRRHGDLDLADEVTAQLVAMSAATIDRRLASVGRRSHAGAGPEPDQAGVAVDVADPDMDLGPTGTSTSPGSSRSTWSATTVVISTPNTDSPSPPSTWPPAGAETRTVRNKAAKWVFAALVELQAHMPFPVLGIDSDTAAGSSTTTCSPGAPTTRSRSPDPDPTSPTTAATWSRRT
jgi:hypothetical protein